MAEKKFNNIRIINKHDTEANWLKAINFIPEQGELIIYDKDSSYSYERFKIGDGSTVVSALPFIDDALKTNFVDQINSAVELLNATKANLTHLHDWADIGENSIGGDTLYWDGNTDNLEYVMSDGTPVAFKISDAVLMRDDWVNGGEFEFSDGSVRSLRGNQILPDFDQYGYMMIDGVLFISSDNFDVDGLIIPTAGIWVTTYDRFVRRITIPGYTGFPTIKKIDKKYLPNFIMPPRRTTVTLSASKWTGDTNPWSQVVTVNGVTVNSKIDLHPTAAQIIELQNSDIALIAENDDGVVTVYALGDKPIVDYTMQALITEVILV